MSQTDESMIGRESSAVPGRFGEPLTVEHVRWSRQEGNAAPNRPMFVCLHGWGSNEDDLVDMMRYVAPYNDYVSLRAPLVLAPGAYSWFHDAVPAGEDLDRDAFAAASAVVRWIEQHICADRELVPIGFSQGGLLASHLLRLNPQRYRAAVVLSGFVAHGDVPGSAPADEELSALNVPVFFGYGDDDAVIPKYELFGAAAWLEEHTWLKCKSYPKLDHAVSLSEFSDLRQWLADNNISSGVL